MKASLCNFCPNPIFLGIVSNNLVSLRKILKRKMQRNLTLIFFISLLHGNLIGLAAERVPNLIVFGGQVFEVIKTDGKITDIRLKAEDETPSTSPAETPKLCFFSIIYKPSLISKLVLPPSTEDFSPIFVKKLIRLRFARSRLPFADDELVIRFG